MQTAYSRRMAPGFPGLKYDAGDDRVESAAAEGDVPFGRAVVKGTFDNGIGGNAGNGGSSKVKIPDADGQVFRGISVHTHSIPQGRAYSGYPDTEAVGYMRKGLIWVEVMDAVAPDEPAFFVHTGEAADLGKFANAAANAAADADVVPGANNVGNGVFGAVTLTIPPAMTGDYIVELTGDGATAPFKVTDPLGTIIGTGNVGTLFDEAGFSFTLADGAVNFVAMDMFTVHVSGEWEADAVPTGIFRTPTSGPGIAVLEVNLP